MFSGAGHYPGPGRSRDESGLELPYDQYSKIAVARKKYHHSIFHWMLIYSGIPFLKQIYLNSIETYGKKTRKQNCPKTK